MRVSNLVVWFSAFSILAGVSACHSEEKTSHRSTSSPLASDAVGQKSNETNDNVVQSPNSVSNDTLVDNTTNTGPRSDSLEEQGDVPVEESEEGETDTPEQLQALLGAWQGECYENFYADEEPIKAMKVRLILEDGKMTRQIVSFMDAACTVEATEADYEQIRQYLLPMAGDLIEVWMEDYRASFDFSFVLGALRDDGLTPIDITNSDSVTDFSSYKIEGSELAIFASCTADDVTLGFCEAVSGDTAENRTVSGYAEVWTK